MEFQVPETVSPVKMKRKRPYDEDYEMTLFRRVRIKTLIEPPTPFDSHNERNLRQTSSYWSVLEQEEFPALLQHFGTDWLGIAKHMKSKTPVMVCTSSSLTVSAMAATRPEV
jgi:hypothetical protein